MSQRVAIIAAMERELAPLLQGWELSTVNAAGRPLICYESDHAVAVFGGMGCKRAEQAAWAVVERYQPQALISAGLAGALIRSMKAGNIVLPNVIVDAATGTEYRCNLGGEVIGGGVLVSNFEIARRQGKQELVDCFHALVVDMEAAGVARVAMEADLGFRCVKAISDELDFDMPPLGRFVTEDGGFETGRLVRWAILHPQHWQSLVVLGRNSRRATRVLCEWLRTNLPGNLRAAKVTAVGECSRP